jgi:hypothetical protein
MGVARSLFSYGQALLPSLLMGVRCLWQAPQTRRAATIFLFDFTLRFLSNTKQDVP